MLTTVRIYLVESVRKSFIIISSSVKDGRTSGLHCQPVLMEYVTKLHTDMINDILLAQHRDQECKFVVVLVSSHSAEHQIVH